MNGNTTVGIIGGGRMGAAADECFRTWSPEQRAELQGRLDKALLGQK